LSGPRRLQFVTRQDCGLCAYLLKLLAPYEAAGKVELEVVPIETHPGGEALQWLLMPLGSDADPDTLQVIEAGGTRVLFLDLTLAADVAVSLAAHLPLGEQIAAIVHQIEHAVTEDEAQLVAGAGLLEVELGGSERAMEGVHGRVVESRVVERPGDRLVALQAPVLDLQTLGISCADEETHEGDDEHVEDCS
jgi:hypothetical protein